MSKHTPGPWRAIEWSSHAATTVVAGDDDKVIAECAGHGGYARDRVADARLIAAAPELLAVVLAALPALERDATALLRTIDPNDEDAAFRREGVQAILDAACAAIAKATGSKS